MLLCKHRTIIFFSGTTWFIAGVFLLILGLRFLMVSLSFSPNTIHFSLLNMFGSEQNVRENGAIFLITFALILGFLKGKYILSKSAFREINRISLLPNPISIKHFYSKKYYFIFSTMLLLGMLMRHLPISYDTRGFIDVIIGSALLQGSLFYFKHLLNSWKKSHE